MSSRNSNDILLSIVCLTYNHVNYIRQALEGFVNQVTNFNYEVIVHDDASTDGTAQIIKNYALLYPQIIKPIFQSVNQWSRATKISKTFIYPKIKGKYVAFCEGDDFWTDPYKLQLQVDFLEKNPCYSICFHPVKFLYEGSSKSEIFPSIDYRFNKDTLLLKHLLLRNFIQTNSVVYRWRFHKENVNLIPDNILPGDWFLHLLHAQIGKIYCIDRVMAVYRRHSGSLWFDSYQSLAWYKRCGMYNINFFMNMETYFNVNRSYQISLLIKKMLYIAKMEHNNLLISKLQSNSYCNRFSKFHLTYMYFLTKILCLFTFGFTYQRLRSFRKILRQLLKSE